MGSGQALGPSCSCGRFQTLTITCTHVERAGAPRHGLPVRSAEVVTLGRRSSNRNPLATWPATSQPRWGKHLGVYFNRGILNQFVMDGLGLFSFFQGGFGRSP